MKAVAKRGTRVASVCSGTIMLAEAGLLDGKRATTHWHRARQFLARYPKVKLESDNIFVRDGNIWSSAGITAGIDLALAMAAEDYGDEIVEKTAKQLVLYHRRSGGQSQFSSLLELKAPTGRFGPLLTWARENLDARLTVEDLAERAGMSARHFTRAFIAETGATPSKAIERLRIEVARERVQSSSEAIERVAEVTGFRDPERMRRAFIRAFGQPPQSLRRAARAGCNLPGAGWWRGFRAYLTDVKRSGQENKTMAAFLRHLFPALPDRNPSAAPAARGSPLHRVTEWKRQQADFVIENIRFVHDPLWNTRFFSLQAARDGQAGSGVPHVPS